MKVATSTFGAGLSPSRAACSAVRFGLKWKRGWHELAGAFAGGRSPR